MEDEDKNPRLHPDVVYECCVEEHEHCYGGWWDCVQREENNSEAVVSEDFLAGLGFTFLGDNRKTEKENEETSD